MSKAIGKFDKWSQEMEDEAVSIRMAGERKVKETALIKGISELTRLGDFGGLRTPKGEDALQLLNICGIVIENMSPELQKIGDQQGSSGHHNLSCHCMDLKYVLGLITPRK